MAETGSTRVRRRINTLFASSLDHQRTKGGRRVPHSAASPSYLQNRSRTREKARYKGYAGCTVRLCRAG
jgi:hypothetical protein